MGSKFCNLNVYGAELTAVQAYCPGCAVQAFASGWTTAAGECLTWETLPKTARRISKALSVPVLSTVYFDDDYVEFVLYRDGKRAARHIPASYEGYPRRAGKPGDWVEVLGLSPEQENTLKIIFKETSPEISLHLLECVLGCPLWADAETIADAAGKTIIGDGSYLEAYIERKNAERKIKIKNQTKLTLLDEKSSDWFWTISNPIVNLQYDAQRLHSFWEIREGRFHLLFQHPVQGLVDDFTLCGRTENAFFIVSKETTERKERLPEKEKTVIHVFSDRGAVLDKICIQVLSGDGKILEQICPNKSHTFHVSFLDNDRLLINSLCWNFRTHREEWKLEIEPDSYGVGPLCRLSNGRLAAAYHTDKTGFLISFLPDGSGQAVRKLPSVRHWDLPLPFGEGLCLACENQLICYNSALEELWNITFNEGIGFGGTQILDAGTKMLYMSTYRRIMAFDLQKREICAAWETIPGENCYLYDFLPGAGPIMLTGSSSIQVWNRALEPISRHRIKGVVGSCVHQNGKTYLLTRTLPDVTFGRGWERIPAEPCILRLYELKPPKTV